MDRAAHRAQVARIVANGAGDEISLRWQGKGAAFPALIMRDNPRATRATPDEGALNLEVLTIARDVAVAGVKVFAGELPREGQHFTGADGRRFRIEDDRSVSNAATLVYACSASPS